jgi:hypothetical protein
MNTLFIGDIHSRVDLVEKAIEIANDTEVRLIFLGDLIDGDSSSSFKDSARCIQLIRSVNAECVLGNHELYPLFASSRQQLKRWWKAEDAATINRIVYEWEQISQYLEPVDLKWMKNLPLYLRGQDSFANEWIAVHAKLPIGAMGLPSAYVDSFPTEEQIELTDNTYTKPFWATEYDGRFGHCYFGHTRSIKVNNRVQFDHATLLDWGVKKGGTTGACFLGDKPFDLDSV